MPTSSYVAEIRNYTETEKPPENPPTRFVFEEGWDVWARLVGVWVVCRRVFGVYAALLAFSTHFGQMRALKWRFVS